MFNPLFSLFLVSQILNAFSMILINNQTFLIVQWSDVGPFPANSTEVVLRTTGNLTGRVVWLPTPLYNSPSHMDPFLKQIKELATAGCVGIICTYRDRPLPGGFLYGTVDSNFAIPVGLVSWDVNLFLQSVGNNATFQFISWDPNPFDVTHTGPSYVVITVLMTLMFVINVIYSSYRIVKWIYTLGKRFEFNIGFGCLSLEWITNVIRTIQVILFTLHNNYHIANIDLIGSLAIVLTLITSILVVLFWLDLTSDPFYKGKFLGAMKIPAIICVGFLILFEIIFDVAQTKTNFDFYSIKVSLYIIMHFIVVLFNIVAGFRILGNLKKQTDSKTKLKKVIQRIILSGIVTIIGIIFYGLMLSNAILSSQYTSVVVFFLLYVTFWLQSLLLIMIFKIPKHRDGMSSTTNTSIKENSLTITKEEITNTKELDTE